LKTPSERGSIDVPALLSRRFFFPFAAQNPRAYRVRGEVLNENDLYGINRARLMLDQGALKQNRPLNARARGSGVVLGMRFAKDSLEKLVTLLLKKRWSFSN
jgi:hypothetical protein